MSAAIIICPAELPLASLLTSLHAESFGAECWSLEQIRGSLVLPTTKAWIAYKSAQPAGFILCQIVPDQSEILTLCVTPALRGKGVGLALLQQAIKNAENESSGQIFLEVAADNMAARKIYEQSGFTISGTRANYYKRGAVTVDAVMYNYALTQAMHPIKKIKIRDAF